MSRPSAVAKIIAVLALLVFAACNNPNEKTAATAVADSPKVSAPDTPKTPEFKPFDVVEISHVVKDYSKWKAVFDTDSAARKESGMEFITIGRKNDHPNDLVIALKIADVQKAKAFSADPKLKKTMEKGGVISKPDITFYHVVRFNPKSNEKQWVLISHKVKDFDAWLKVFDAEGPATRESFGLKDVVLARGIDDPNLVHIVFDIKDMAKAKARMNAPELKKLMTDAGVEGAPKISFYTTAE
jgi:hypothetical protein